jgi:hypothetical protein
MNHIRTKTKYTVYKTPLRLRASLSDDYVNRDVIIRKLLNNCLTVRWDPKSPYRRSR